MTAARKKRIYYVSPNSGGISYYRCTMPAYYLNRAGLAETAVDFGRFQKEFVDWADVIVVQRVLGKGIQHLIHYCHMRGKKVVFEIDDNVWQFPDSPEYQDAQAKDVPAQTTDIIDRCDAVTVSTQAIANEIEKTSKTPVTVIPNALDFEQWKQLDIRHEHFLVGWAGGHYHVQDLEMIVPGLKKIIEQNQKTTLVFLGCCPMQLLIDHPDKVFMQEFVSVEMFPKTMSVMKFDIGLAPLYETEFAKSRSNIRLLQYSALQIPSVVSYYGEYGKAIDDGFPAVSVTKDGSWAEAVQWYIDNPEQRIEIGKKAKEYVAERYDIKNNVRNWNDVYNYL